MMTIADRMQYALVLAPHPDDEVLGCGGTIARLAAQGCLVDVAIVTKGVPPRFAAAQAAMVREETGRAHALLGIRTTHFLDLPAAALDQLAHADLNRAIGTLVNDLRPDTLFIPFAGDLHLDHRLVFDAAMVAARPRGDAYPLRILAYETVSETSWSAPHIAPSFQPNVFIDISSHLEAKIDAFACFVSQVRPYPDERSLDTLRALAMVRGSCVSRAAAEAFMLVREVG
jgi:LmbE family N-acetylglucosaminyl deacetylase